MTMNDKKCQAILLQCSRMLNKVQEYVNQQGYSKTDKSLESITKQIKATIGILVYEQRASQLKQRALQLKQFKEKQASKSILSEVHEKFQKDLPKLPKLQKSLSDLL
jgi:hypothetical protein